MQYLLQGMQTITPADTTLIQGIWPLNYLTYHTIWFQNMLCCSRVLHVAPGYSIAHRMLLYCSGYHIYCRGCNLLQGMQSTAGDANNYPSGYHTNTGYMAFELSHISYHMAPEHAMLLQGTPRCSRVLHCSIGCCSTAADTTSTAGDAIYCRGCNLLQGMQTITPADTTLIQGIWPLNYLTYHTIWLQNMLCCSRVLHVAPGYSIAP